MLVGRGGGVVHYVTGKWEILMTMGAGSGSVSNKDTNVFRVKGMKVQSNSSKISKMQQLEPCFLVFADLSAGQGDLLSHHVSYAFI